MMIWRLLVVLWVSLSIVTSASFTDSPNPLTRREFARRMATIHRGMLASEVRDLLGPPDEVLTDLDAARRYPSHQRHEVWCYGTSEHLTLPLLGQVCINANMHVMVDPMERDAPLPSADFDEGQMRRLLLLIDGISDEAEFDPQTLIATVNALQPLGADAALEVVEEFARINPSLRFDAAFKASWVLQTLFGYGPLLRLAIVDDVPFLPCRPGGYSGPSPQEGMYMACSRIREKGLALRPTRLKPIADLRKLHEDALKSVARPDGVDETRRRIHDQFARLVAPVYKMPPPVDQGRILDDDPSWWAEIDARLAKLSVRWDEASNQYVRK